MGEITDGIQLIPMQHYMLLCTILFSIGALGVMLRRNVIILLMCIELMLNSVNLLLAAFATHHGDASGQVFVFFIMVVAAAEAAVGLGIIMMIYRNTKSTDISLLDKLKF
jgi:NADH-quinone oxidoreductase subunit K